MGINGEVSNSKATNMEAAIEWMGYLHVRHILWSYFTQQTFQWLLSESSGASVINCEVNNKIYVQIENKILWYNTQSKITPFR